MAYYTNIIKSNMGHLGQKCETLQMELLIRIKAEVLEPRESSGIKHMKIKWLK